MKMWCQVCTTPPAERFSVDLDLNCLAAMTDHWRADHPDVDPESIPDEQLVTLFLHRIKP